MIGYKITAKNEKLKYCRIYRGMFEGSPKLESKAKSIAAKQVLKQIMKQGAQFVVGGPAYPAHRVRRDPARAMHRFYALRVARDLFGGRALLREWGARWVSSSLWSVSRVHARVPAERRLMLRIWL